MSATGTLYLVATPIGNLEDISLRAVRILKDASMIACEDTRRTRGLLAHLNLRTPIMSMHEHNERTRIPQILAMLREGKDVAVVSDAGMPSISDPGGALAAAAARAGVRVVPIPGPSAVTAAIALADFPAEQFAFVGFLPRRRGERRTMLSALAPLPMALVFFEAPHRVRETLADLEKVIGARRVVLARELTKLHEEVLRGTVSEVLDTLGKAPRGEITLVVEGPGSKRSLSGEQNLGRQAGACGHPARSPMEILERLRAEGLSRRDAARLVSKMYDLRRQELYRLMSGESAAKDVGEDD